MLFSPCVSTPPHLRKLIARLRSPLHLLLVSSLSCDPSPSPWLPSLRAAAKYGHMERARRAHALVVTSGAASDRFLANNLIAAYAKCGSLSAARDVFDQMPKRDTVSWNSLLSAYALHGAAADAFGLFRVMLRSTVAPTNLTFTPILKLCSVSPHMLPISQAVHCCSVRFGLDSDSLVSSALINVYSKFGLLEDARSLFDEMAERDVVLWNIMIKGYAQMGFAKDAFLMFSELHRSDSLQPDNGSIHGIFLKRELHRELEQVQAYGIKSCLLDDSSDVISWNKAISEYVKNGQSDFALDCFMEMRKLNVGYDNVTFVVVLSAIAGTEYFDLSEQLHGIAIKVGFSTDVSVSNNLINMYAKMGNLNCARQVFDEMNEVDLVSWNSMIASCANNGLEEESINYLMDMLKHGVIPDQFTLASVLRACSGITRNSSLHRQLHIFALKMDLTMDSFVLTALIDAYSKMGCMDEAKLLFSHMDCFDIASGNALVAGYVAIGDNHEALELFSSIIRTGQLPNHFTLATALKACSSLVALEQGKQIHSQAVKLGFDSDLCVSSGILDMYIKCGNARDASTTFINISEPDDVAWTAMIDGCVENGDEERALSLYRQMRQSGAFPDEFTLASLIKACSYLAALEQGKQIHANAIKLECASDAFVGTSIMDMYAKCGNVEDSFTLFKNMGVKSIASWNAMLLGFAQHGNGNEVMKLFKKMQLEGLRPDKITFIGVLSACSHSGLVSEAYRHFNSMRTEYGIEPEVEHYSCLVDVLGRAGLLSEAENVIKSMPFDASASLYRALLGACRIQRNMEVGQRIATKLLSLDPLDSSAYVLLSNIYAAANQWGDVVDARKSMKSRNVKKDPGYSWIEVKNKVHLFVVDDRSHPETAAIYHKLEDLIKRIKDEGYVPDTDFVLLDVEEEEKECAICYHSEKLAIAYGLLSVPPPLRIRVIKNLRVCGDCHNAIKYISNVTGREIVLRDASRFHHFSNGACTCGDYW
ncbi:Pentatricopeptide repeat-containing protein [Ananas comosus]|uniref:Pentatricopeptide repeat-containing protein n=1 Tax=Ananas comosus TaxID=4615 RepID=A0A199W8S0_ANACO|nr:Pentatricopeptide repeat-containing protein [Ananas comosus]